MQQCEEEDGDNQTLFAAKGGTSTLDAIRDFVIKTEIARDHAAKVFEVKQVSESRSSLPIVMCGAPFS